MAVFSLAPMSLVLHCQLDLILHDYAMHTRHGVDLWVLIVAAIGSLRDGAAWDYGVDDTGKGMDTSRQHQAPKHTTRRQTDKPKTNTHRKKIGITNLIISDNVGKEAAHKRSYFPVYPGNTF
jgi:hypothetical protein